MNFNCTHFPQRIIDSLNRAYKTPTPIQQFSWPILLSGNDLIGIAETGSGKTISYILPAITHLQGQRNTFKGFRQPIILVLAPTRELAQQIDEESDKFGTEVGVETMVVYGGADKGRQKWDLRKGCDILVATPGRLLDLMETNLVSGKQVTILIIDEADRMLDMGFEPQLRKVIGQLRPDRQTCMWSATWPKEVQTLASEFLIKPVYLQIGQDELSINPNIKHQVELVNEQRKIIRIRQILLQKGPRQKGLIFSQRKTKVDDLSRELKRQGFPNLPIHGDKSQREREYVMGQFKRGSIPIMVATDVAARGLDIKDINYVINFDFPMQIQDYIHRIGRTGRAGNSGMSHTFLTAEDARHAEDLQKILIEANQEVPFELRELVQAKRNLRKFPFFPICAVFKLFDKIQLMCAVLRIKMISIILVRVQFMFVKELYHFLEKLFQCQSGLFNEYAPSFQFFQNQQLLLLVQNSFESLNLPEKFIIFIIFYLQKEANQIKAFKYLLYLINSLEIMNQNILLRETILQITVISIIIQLKNLC